MATHRSPLVLSLFGLLFARHRRTALVVAIARTGNRQDAEDITQDVMLKLFSRLNSFEGRSSFKTWMVRVTRNACKDWLKKKAISKQYSEALANEPQDDMESKWAVCNGPSAVKFSAVGYFFGKRLHEALDVPIGLIDRSDY